MSSSRRLATLCYPLLRAALAVIAATVLASSLAQAQVPTQIPAKGRAKQGAPLMHKMADGGAHDFIVVFDDRAIRKQVLALQAETGLASHQRRIVERRASLYAARKQEVFAAFAPAEATLLKDYSHLPLGFVRVHSPQALTRLLDHPGVLSVHEDTVEHLALAQSLPLIGQPQVAAQGNGGAGTAVAVLDTGVDYTAAAFGSCTAPGVPANCRVAYAKDFRPGDPGAAREHGSNVAGIVAGVAPGTKIIDLKVFGSSTANGSDILDAINWAIANKSTYNIVALNMSLGSGKYPSQVASGPNYTAIAQARAAGILTVVAAGNDGFTDSLSNWGATQGAVSVGAVYDSALGAENWGAPSRCSDPVTAADKVTCFSNSASFLTLLAPGSEITAAGITESGTSQATPHVAGATAVLRAAFPSDSLDQTVARLSNGIMVTDSRNELVKPRLYLPLALGLGAPCSYSLSETSRAFAAGSGSGSVGVSAGAGCSWAAAPNTSDSSWISISAGSTGSGSGTVAYSVAANSNVSSRSGTLTVAGQSYTVTQAGSAANTANILLNPGFEAGPVAWTQLSASTYPVITAYLNPSANDSWYAWLCGYDDCADSLSQDLTIPADAQSASLQFYYSVETDETLGLGAYDTMEVRVYSPPGASSYTLLDTYSNLDATADWTLGPRYDLSAFRGRAIRLQFAATSDASLSTSFYLDDVLLNVTGAAPDTQAPSVPTGLTATVVSATQINLAWNASTDNVGVTAYKIYSGGTLVATVGNVTASSRSNVPSTSYRYTVSACEAAGNCSAQSAAATATTPALPDTQAPTVPTGLTATVTASTHINLAWNASTDNVGVTAYKIYSGGTLVGSVGNVTSSTRTNTPGTTYRYTVSACDAAGNCSAQSAVASATTPAVADTQAPTVPTGLTATASSSSAIHLAWAASSDNVGVTAYKVYRGGTVVATLGNVTSYDDTGLRAATAYVYSVSACDAAANCSDPSAVASANTPASSAAPAAPSNVTAVAGNGRATVSFTPGAIGSGTLVNYRAACGVDNTHLIYNTGSASPITVTGLANGTAYYCWVISLSSVGYGPWSAPSSLITPSATSNPYSGLWYNPNESGWGVSVAQHASMIFVAAFTYLPSGQPTWYVISSCPVLLNSCAGAIYAVSGATAPTQPWNAAAMQVRLAGSGMLVFDDANNGRFTFTIDGVSGVKTITRELFANGTAQFAVDYTDLWWNQNESGWGISLSQDHGMLFAAWYVYDASGRAIWYVVPSCPLAAASGGNRCSGDLYQVSGGSPLTSAWNPSLAIPKVGTATISFSDANNGQIAYTLNGVAGSKAITRQPF